MLRYRYIFQATIIFFSIFCNTGFIIAQNPSEILEDNSRKIGFFMEKESYDSVLFYYKENLSITDNAPDKNIILSEIGYIHALLSDYEKSAAAYQKALDHALKFTPDSLRFISDQYYYIGYNNHELGDLDKALVFYKKSLSLTSRKNDMEGYADILSAITSVYLRKSDYDNAILFVSQALHLYQIIKNDAEIVSANADLALLHYFKQDYSNALKYSEASVQFEKDKNISNRHHVSSFNNHALILIQLNRFKEARAFIKKAFGIHHSGYGRLLGITHFNQAFLYYKIGDLEKASAGFEKSVSYYIEKYPNGHINIGKAYYYLGQIKNTQKDNEAAAEYFQKSLHSLVPGFTREDILENPALEQYCISKRNLLRALISKAKLLGRIYSPDKEDGPKLITKVFDTYNLAIEVSEELRRSYKSEKSRYFLAEETKELFEGAVLFSYDLYQKTGDRQYLEKAFFYVEKNQTPILLQNHLAIEGQNIGGVPTDIIQQERQLEIDFSFYKNQKARAEEKGDKRKINLYSEYLFNCKQQLDSLRINSKKKYPAYFEYQYGNHVSELSEVQESLSENQLFLQYYLTGNRIYVFSIHKNTADLSLINDAQKIRNTNEDLLESIQNPLAQVLSEQQSYEQLTYSAHYLYTHLVRSFLENNHPGITRLIISSNGFLNEIPFEVFLGKLPEKEINNYLSLPYLIKDFAVSYQPSASLMVRLKNTRLKEAKKELLAFAPFSSENKIMGSAFTRAYLANLPYTRKEVESLEELFDTEALYHRESSKKAFLEKAGGFSMLHLATHGVADFENAANAHLLFYPENATDSTGHILYNYEIQNMELNANLVVLSACETGAGKIDRGEGILSLARGFFYTGVPSVIMSKWQINDRSSSLVINHLYTNLKSGAKKDVALQDAKKAYLENEADLITAHPFYWAGLVQLGNSEALAVKGMGWMGILLVAIAVFALGFVGWKYYKI